MSLSFDNAKAVEVYAEKTELFPVEERLFNEYLTPPGKLLDIGCGTGRTTRHLADMGHDVIGVDISSEMIKRAQTLHPDLSFKVMDVCNLDYFDNCFDYVVFSFNGLDYIYPETNRITALREIHSVLCPGGCFIYSSHEKNSIPGMKRNWRRKPRPYRGFYYKERTTYGDLVTYYGTTQRNLAALRMVGFTEPRFTETAGKAWRYYTAWKA